MKIIFLDIDGVLCTRRSHLVYGKEGRTWWDWDPLGCAAVAKACEKGARIVISSTWRQTNHRDELMFQLEKYGLINLLYRPDWMTPILGEARGVEIHAYLDKHKEIHQYRILDDDQNMLDYQLPNFIQTDPDEGMTGQNIKNLLNWSGALKS